MKTKEPGVYKRGAVYYLSVGLPASPDFPKGHRVRRAAGTNFAEAVAARNRLLGRKASSDLSEADYDPRAAAEKAKAGGVLFEKLAELYVSSRLAAGKRADSYYKLLRFDKLGKVVPGVWLTAFEGRRVATITSAEIETLLATWTKDRKLSPRSRNEYLSELCGALSFAFRKGWIPEHPARFGRVERFAENNLRDRWLRPHEIQALAAQARADGRAYLADVIEFAALTGKRLGEIVGLRRADLTTDGAGDPALWLGKTKNGTPELLPITGEALALVKRKAAACDSPSARLFPGPGGRTVRQAVARYFRPTVEAVAKKNPDWRLAHGRGTGEVSFHTLRASFATIGSAAGMSERALMVAGNWKTRTMLDRYVRRDDDALRAALGRVGSLVLGTFGDGHTTDTTAEAAESVTDAS